MRPCRHRGTGRHAFAPTAPNSSVAPRRSDRSRWRSRRMRQRRATNGRDGIPPHNAHGVPPVKIPPPASRAPTRPSSHPQFRTHDRHPRRHHTPRPRREIWDGWSHATARCTPRSSGGTWTLKCSWRASPPISLRRMIRPANAAGLPSGPRLPELNGLDRCFSCAIPSAQVWPSCACCSSIRRRVDSDWANVWSMNAPRSHARPDITRSRCGRTAFLPRHGPSISVQVTDWCSPRPEPNFGKDLVGEDVGADTLVRATRLPYRPDYHPDNGIGAKLTRWCARGTPPRHRE